MRNTLTEHLLEEIAALVRGVQLEADLLAALGLGLDHESVAANMRHDRANTSVVAAVEADRDAQDAGERAHQSLIVGREPAELGMAGLRRALAVIASDLGDDLDLGVGEARQFAVADHVVAVQVMLAVRDHQTDVGQQRAGLEVLASVGRQPVQLSRWRRTIAGPTRRRARSGRGRRRIVRRAP